MLKGRIQDEMKAAMRAGDKPRLATIRLIMAAIKQREVDDRRELDEPELIAILDKMVKQRRESITQFEKGGRDELAAKEQAEIEIIQEFLPQPLSAEEVEQLINAAIESTGASSIKDMGAVMGQLRPQLQGRADMGAVSGQIKARLAG